MTRSVQQRSNPAPAEALGWGSLALGVPPTAMPGRFVEALGIRDDSSSRAWARVVGMREFAHAAGILAIEHPRPLVSIWSRVGGDAMDLALLVGAMMTKRRRTGRMVGAMAAVIGISIADVMTALQLSRQPEPGPMAAPGRPQKDRPAGRDHARHVTAAITVRQPREEVYRFWHDFQNLPRFMAHLESVKPTGDRRTHWKATAPMGRTVEWDAEIVDDRPNERIAWRTTNGGAVANSGTVQFLQAPGGRGTEIHLDMDYSVPGGAVGTTFAKLFGEEPGIQVRDDLRRFKQVIETGDVVRSEGSPEGPLARRLIMQRPAQPVGRSAS